MAFEIFGFKIERRSQEKPNANIPAFTLPENDDGSLMIETPSGELLNLTSPLISEII